MKGIIGALIILLAHLQMNAQAVKLDLSGIPGNRVAVSSLAQSSNGAFGSLFKDSEIARLQPFSLSLRNLSGKSIIGLTVRWVLTDASGASHKVDYSSDSLFLVYTPVLGADETLLVTPAFLLPEKLVGSGFTGPVSSAGELANDFEMAKSIVAALDVVIFDDGEVIGPDRAAMVKNIRARRAAASEITSMVQALINHGEDPTAKLESIASLSPVSEDDLVGKWSVRIARMLLRSRHIRGDLDLLKALPDIDFRHVG